MATLNKKQSLYSFAKYVKGTLENYWAGTDRAITRNHIPRFRHSDAVRVITALLDSTVECSEVSYRERESEREGGILYVAVGFMSRMNLLTNTMS